MLCQGLKTLNKLNAAKEAKRVVAKKHNTAEAERQATTRTSSTAPSSSISCNTLAYSPKS